MKRLLLAILFIIAVSTSGFAQTGQQFAFADGNTYINNSFNGGNPDDPYINFYPNPVRTTLTIKFAQRGNYTVKIYNIVGEQIMEKSVLDDDTIKLNMSDYNNGMYFLAYELEGRVYTKTFSKAQ